MSTPVMIVGAGSLFAPAPGKGIPAHREPDGVLRQVAPIYALPVEHSWTFFASDQPVE